MHRISKTTYKRWRQHLKYGNNIMEVIGGKQEVMGGMCYFGEQSGQGFIYKDNKAFREHKGICYIAECAFGQSNSIIMTPNDVYENICSGSVSTYYSIIDYVKQVCNDSIFKDDNFVPCSIRMEFINYIAECAFENIDWQCISTYINEIDLEEEWKIWK